MTEPPQGQLKQAEIDFFDKHAECDEYNVFTEAATQKIIDAFVSSTGLGRGVRVVDLGCGSGTFTRLLADRGYIAQGVDLSSRTISRARRIHPHIKFMEGDIESLPLPDCSFDGVLLSGVVHHLQTPADVRPRFIGYSSRTAGFSLSTQTVSIRSCIFIEIEAHFFIVL
jgi:ubiquinone/menaquinone biosynthesis C-methylase UbiE